MSAGFCNTLAEAQTRRVSRDAFAAGHWISMLRKGFENVEKSIHTHNSGILSLAETSQLLQHIGWMRRKDFIRDALQFTIKSTNTPSESQISHARIVLSSPRQLMSPRTAGRTVAEQVLEHLDVDGSGFIELDDLIKFTLTGFEHFGNGKLDSLEGRFFQLVQENVMLGAGKSTRQTMRGEQTIQNQKSPKALELRSHQQYERGVLWKNAIDQATEDKQNEVIEAELGKCTFKPVVLQKPSLVEQHWRRRELLSHDRKPLALGRAGVYDRLYSCAIGNHFRDLGEHEVSCASEATRISDFQKELLKKKNRRATADHIERVKLARKHRELQKKALEQYGLSTPTTSQKRERITGNTSTFQSSGDSKVRTIPKSESLGPTLYNFDQSTIKHSRTTNRIHTLKPEIAREANDRDIDVLMVNIRYIQRTQSPVNSDVDKARFGALSIAFGDKPGELVNSFMCNHMVSGSQYSKLYCCIVRVMAKEKLLKCSFTDKELYQRSRCLLPPFTVNARKFQPSLGCVLSTSTRGTSIVSAAQGDVSRVPEHGGHSTNGQLRRHSEIPTASTSMVTTVSNGQLCTPVIATDEWKQWWSSFRKRRHTVEVLAKHIPTTAPVQQMAPGHHISRNNSISTDPGSERPNLSNSRSQKNTEETTRHCEPRAVCTKPGFVESSTKQEHGSVDWKSNVRDGDEITVSGKLDIQVSDTEEKMEFHELDWNQILTAS